ncbi:MAG: prephenate dehydratase [Lachnospiraceae bacterium]
MNDLTEIRSQIDLLDEQMLQLFEQRMELCDQVAQFKIQNGRKVLDSKREAEKISKLKAMAHNSFNKHGVEELFRQIMAMSRKLQYQRLAMEGVTGRLPFVCVDEIERNNVRVVFQGVEGAYSQAAMEQFFGQDVRSFHVESWRDAMEAISEGTADYAVLPIENSTAGIVSDIYDLLVEFDNYIVGEQVIRIEHALLGTKDAAIDQIKTVYSHPQGLMQSAEFLHTHPEWALKELENTAVAAKKVLEDADPTQAAIAGKQNAHIYGLKVLKCPVNQNTQNFTRFIVVTNQKLYCRNARKVSICFELPHESGSLYNILSHFIYNGLNMSKIESRPIPDRNWEYRFFVDFVGNLADDGVKNAVRGIAEEALNLRILGNY